MVKGFLFDFDGTLVDTVGINLASFKYVLGKKLEREVLDDELTIYLGDKPVNTIKSFVEDGVDELLNEFRTHNKEIHDDGICVYEGVIEVLEEMKAKGYKLAIVTSKGREMAMRGIKLYGIDRYMDAIITRDDTEKHKPDPTPLIEACKLLKLNPIEVVMVGDSHNDILSGQAAGAKTCMVSYTAVPYEKMLKIPPTYTVDHIKDLLDIIEKYNKETQEEVV